MKILTSETAIPKICSRYILLNSYNVLGTVLDVGDTMVGIGLEAWPAWAYGVGRSKTGI